MTEVLERNVQILLKLCDGGIEGKYFLYPREIFNVITNRCNLHCMICHDAIFTNNFKNVPLDVTLEKFKEMIPKLTPDMINTPAGRFFENTIYFDYMSGETLLNPEVYEILAYTKEQLPNSHITVLSNGTIPPQKGKEDIIKYIDKLCFSIDGCTKETFEMIRTPAKFEHVMKNLKRWADTRDKFSPNTPLWFNVTLSTMNFHELPGLVSLAGELGFNSINTQPLIVKSEVLNHLKPYLLENMDKKLGGKYLKDAFEIAEKNGVGLIVFRSFKHMFLKDLNTNIIEAADENLCNTEEKNCDGQPDFNPEFNRYCQKFYDLKLNFNEKNELVYLCCYMNDQDLVKRYDIPVKGTPFEIYNSPGWWQLRKDMLEGKLIENCKRCFSGNSDYYRLKDYLLNIEIV